MRLGLRADDTREDTINVSSDVRKTACTLYTTYISDVITREMAMRQTSQCSVLGDRRLIRV